MSKKLFIVIIAFLVIWGLWSLPYSPIAWYDEIIFSSTTHSLITGNGMAAELDFYEPMVLYGPVYFWLTGLITKLFGFGIFTFRLTNFVFAFLTVIVLGRIYNQLHINSKISRIFLLILLTDVLFVANSHSGRMEFVALFFILVSYCIFLSQQEVEYKDAVIISLTLTLAFMTTPRAIVVAIPVATLELYRLIIHKKWIPLFLYVLIPVALYYLWIIYAYGSLVEMIAYVTKPNEMTQTASFADRFLGVDIRISFWHYPLVLTALFAIVYNIKNKSFKKILLYTVPILLYYLLVKDTGMYGVYVLPFYLIIIAMTFTMISKDDKRLRIFYQGFLTLCLAINVCIFVFKALSIVSSVESRDSQHVTHWLKERVPQGAKLCGSYPYYYSAIENGSPYKRITRDYVDMNVTYNNLIQKYRPDYLIVTSISEEKESVRCVDMFKKEVVDSFRSEKKDGFPYNMLNKVQQHSSYDGILYKVIYE